MLVRYSIYRSIPILVNVRYRYLVVSRYFDISNESMITQTILGRYSKYRVSNEISSIVCYDSSSLTCIQGQNTEYRMFYEKKSDREIKEEAVIETLKFEHWSALLKNVTSNPQIFFSHSYQISHSCKKKN